MANPKSGNDEIDMENNLEFYCSRLQYVQYWTVDWDDPDYVIEPLLAPSVDYYPCMNINCFIMPTIFATPIYDFINITMELLFYYGIIKDVPRTKGKIKYFVIKQIKDKYINKRIKYNKKII